MHSALDTSLRALPPDHGLSDADRQRCAISLRSACVYGKLDYRNADQALVTALRYGREPDLALTLAPLPQQMVVPEGENVETTDERDEIRRAIDKRASATIKELLARDVWQQTD